MAIILMTGFEFPPAEKRRDLKRTRRSRVHELLLIAAHKRRLGDFSGARLALQQAAWMRNTIRQIG